MSSGVERFFWKDIDALAFYDQRALAKYIGVEFQLHTTIVVDDEVVEVRVPLTLHSVVDILPAGSDRMNGREFFYLEFSTAPEQETIAQGVYVIEHRDLGVFRLFLSPRRSDLFQAVPDDDPIVVSTNTNLYRAIVYRLAYSAMGSVVAQGADWPVHASRFNPDSSLDFAPAVTGDVISAEAVFEEGYGPQGEE